MAYTTIDDPTKYFQVIKYVGNQTDDRAMTFDGNSDMQPDWFLTKRYDSGSDHWDIQDTCRGLVDGSGDGVSLYPASTNTENSDTGKIKTATSDQEGSWSRRGDILDIFPVCAVLLGSNNRL